MGLYPRGLYNIIDSRIESLAIRSLDHHASWSYEHCSRCDPGLASLLLLLFTIVLYFWQGSSPTFTQATKELVNIQFILCLSVPADRVTQTNRQRRLSVKKRDVDLKADIALHAWERHLRAIVGLRDVTCYGITHCYLPPDTSERAPPNPSHAVWYSTCTYPGGMEGWVDLVDLVALRPAVYTVSLIAVNGHLNLHTVHSNQMITSQARPWKHTGSLGSCHV